MSTQKDRFHNLIKKFSDAEAKADDNFQSDLKNQFLAQSNQKTSNFNFIKALLSMSKFKLGGVFMLFVMVLSVASYVGYPYAKNIYVERTLDEDKFIQDVFATNYSDDAVGNQSANAETASLADSSSVAGPVIRGSISNVGIDTDDSYVESTVTTVPGPAYEQCEGMHVSFDKDAGEIVYKTDNYYGDDKSYSRYEEYVDGERIDVYISKYESGSDTSYTYLGGSYAIKETYTYDEQIMELYGEDIAAEEELILEHLDEELEALRSEPTFVRVDEVDGQEVYVFDYFEHYQSCDVMYAEPLKSNKQVLTRAFIEPESKEILKAEYYSKSVSDENLISTQTFEFDSKDVEYANVAERFEFDVNVEVREFEYSDDSSSELSLPENLTELDIELLKADDLVLEYVFADDGTTFAAPAHYSDRDFYPEGEYGDEVYEAYNSDYAEEAYMEDFGFSLASSDDASVWVSFSVMEDEYESFEEYQTSSKRFGFENEFERLDSITLSIDGESVDAEVYEGQFDVLEPIFDEESSEGSVSEFNESFIVVYFNYAGDTYIINNVSDYESLADYEFETLNTSSDYSEVEEYYNESMENLKDRGFSEPGFEGELEEVIEN